MKGRKYLDPALDRFEQKRRKKNLEDYQNSRNIERFFAWVGILLFLWVGYYHWELSKGPQWALWYEGYKVFKYKDDE